MVGIGVPPFQRAKLPTEDRNYAGYHSFQNIGEETSESQAKTATPRA
jgi:hypothetical protein